MNIFADSSFFVAYYNPRDQYANQVNTIVDKDLRIQPTPSIVLSEYIYDETMTFLLSTHPYYGYLRAKQFDEDVIGSEKFQFVIITDSLFMKARDVFFRFNKDKRWSFTDCTSYVIMEDYGINRVLTFDTHFSEMGFTVIR